MRKQLVLVKVVKAMSEYTTELRNVLMFLAGNRENDNSESVIETAAPLLFDFDYNFYDPNSKAAFEQDFCRHFYMREIGQETFGLWKHYLRDWMQVEMPYYNQLFESAAIEYSPLDDVNYTRSGLNSSTSSGKSSVIGANRDTTHNDSIQKFSDTPQNNVSNINNGYLTNQTDTSVETTSSSSNESTGTSSANGNGTFSETVKGKMGMKSYAELVQEQRDTFINVKKMCFDALEVLFMQIY